MPTALDALQIQLRTGLYEYPEAAISAPMATVLYVVWVVFYYRADINTSRPGKNAGYQFHPIPASIRMSLIHAPDTLPLYLQAVQ